MQMHPAMIEALMSAREQELQQRRLRAANRRAWRAINGDEGSDRRADAIAIRPARPADSAAISGLAELDGQSRHADRLVALARDPGDEALLVAEANGSIVAALDVAAGRTIAHPFRRSTAARELLELRARQLSAGRAAPRRRFGVLRFGLRPRIG